MSKSFGSQNTSLVFGEDATTGNVVNIKADTNALYTLERGQIGGGEGEESASTAQTRVTSNSNLTGFTDGTTTIQTVSSSPSRLTCLVIPAALVGTATFTDDATAKFVLPATWPAGIYNLPGIRFTTNMKITLSSASDDVYVGWWNIGTGGV